MKCGREFPSITSRLLYGSLTPLTMSPIPSLSLNAPSPRPNASMSQGTPACPSSCASPFASKRERGRTRRVDLEKSLGSGTTSTFTTLVKGRKDGDRDNDDGMSNALQPDACVFQEVPSKKAALLKPTLIPQKNSGRSYAICSLAKHLCEQNKKNRSKLTVNHAAGSRLFQRTRACMKNQDNGEINPSRDERMDAFQRQCDLEGKTYTEIEHQLAKARDEIEAMRAREKVLQEFAKKQAEMEATLWDHRKEQWAKQEHIQLE
ncbi:hypothetical protein CJ030_MR2G001910 [Morella rubra]|uniref:Uncharacterized protein n=1 Tax=Morella rubra TaxID=262757 RepID=A0A6A1WCW9_9ROSI|nr:hypothetical protein CJ030_MR2G001910 [Morella rubra]